MNPRGFLALIPLAIFCLLLALAVWNRGQPRLPQSWAVETEAGRRSAARFMGVYLVALAATLLLVPLIIGFLAWKAAAGVIVVWGGLALVVAGWGVRRWAGPPRSRAPD